MDKVVNQIYVTYDYDKFLKLDGNRDVKSINKILKSIDTVGQVLSPILVNEKFEIIDGQHRLEAFRARGLPVYYIIQEGIGYAECQNLNIGQSNWSTLDYVKSYASQGDENYQYLLQLLAEFIKDFKLEGVMAFSTNVYPTGGAAHTLIKSKRFAMDQRGYELAKTYMRSAKELGFVAMQKENKLMYRSWYNALAYAYRHQEVSVKRLAECFRANPLALISYSRTEDQLALFDKLYNKGRKKKVFMAMDFQLGKYKDGKEEV